MDLQPIKQTWNNFINLDSKASTNMNEDISASLLFQDKNTTLNMCKNASAPNLMSVHNEEKGTCLNLPSFTEDPSQNYSNSKNNFEL